MSLKAAKTFSQGATMKIYWRFIYGPWKMILPLSQSVAKRVLNQLYSQKHYWLSKHTFLEQNGVFCSATNIVSKSLDTWTNEEFCSFVAWLVKKCRRCKTSVILNDWPCIINSILVTQCFCDFWQECATISVRAFHLVFDDWLSTLKKRNSEFS